MENKEKYKSDFKNALDAFSIKLREYTSTENGDWSIKGFIDVYKNVYTISSDTKIVSKILEIHLFPQIILFAEEIGYNIILAEQQNYYPDLTFVSKEDSGLKFAVDLKTTYRKKNDIASFTLGSHGSYFKERDKQKNIQFPYNQYLGHYCLGIIYTRADLASETEIYTVQELQEEHETLKKKIGEREVTIVENLKSITSVIKDFDFFVAEKWKIASDKQGSGNTANIGCTLDLEDLRNENGIFSQLDEVWFDEYWMNFGTASMLKDGKSIKITNLRDFLEFKGRPDLQNKIVKKS
ncbi:Type-2 restriction enzyme EcoRV [termite gut metagenome]|uniref:Type-2 restriction enzyme EcoRV n=1 Tax=termite gut metagenome TaxID=433724 RepID=A0A5J4QCE0_9ZZZZ